jgi:hypothetical protein
MRLVDELYEIGQGVDTIPTNLKWRLMIVGPSPRNRLDSAQKSTAVASDTSLNRRHSGHRRAPSVFMAILARDLVNAGMHAMAERDRLLDIGAWRPRPLRKGDRHNSAQEQEQRNRDQYTVHRFSGRR